VAGCRNTAHHPTRSPGAKYIPPASSTTFQGKLRGITCDGSLSDKIHRATHTSGEHATTTRLRTRRPRSCDVTIGGCIRARNEAAAGITERAQYTRISRKQTYGCILCKRCEPLKHRWSGAVWAAETRVHLLVRVRRCAVHSHWLQATVNILAVQRSALSACSTKRPVGGIARAVRPGQKLVWIL
jgi:hypothetical protein